MSVAIETSLEPGAARLSPPSLRPMAFDDYAQVSTLLSANHFTRHPFSEWQGIWTDNPLWRRLGKDFPIGWVLETHDSEIVGVLGSLATRYSLRGEDLVAASGLTWFVSVPYRGFALWLIDEYFGQPADVFINTTVSPDAHPTFEQLSSRIPMGDWETITYWLTSPRAAAEKALRKWKVPAVRPLVGSLAAALRWKDAHRYRRLAPLAGPYSIQSAERFDSSFDVFWRELLRQKSTTLMAHRDSQTLSWHFAIPLRQGRIWIFTAVRHGRIRAYCLLTQQDHVFRLRDGDTMTFRGMRIADYQSIETERDLLPGLLKAALGRCVAEKIDFLENLGKGVPKMHAFDEHAPYRAKLDNWKFYYRAASVALENELSQAQCWDPSPFDGDASME